MQNSNASAWVLRSLLNENLLKAKSRAFHRWRQGSRNATLTGRILRVQNVLLGDAESAEAGSAGSTGLRVPQSPGRAIAGLSKLMARDSGVGARIQASARERGRASARRLKSPGRVPRQQLAATTGAPSHSGAFHLCVNLLSLGLLVYMLTVGALVGRCPVEPAESSTVSALTASCQKAELDRAAIEAQYAECDSSLRTFAEASIDAEDLVNRLGRLFRAAHS